MTKIAHPTSQIVPSQNVKALYEDCKLLLDALVTPKSTVVHMKCGARVLRIMQAFNLLDSTVLPYADLLKANKHERDFLDELDAESSEV